MPVKLNLLGNKFGRWTVISEADPLITPSGNRFSRYLCRCDCGTERLITTNSLTSGRSKSCGCLHNEISAAVCKNNFKSHGDTKSRLYSIYHGIKKRCINENAYNYRNYGARGICICNEWLDSWDCFKEWAYASGYNDTLSIDRIDVNGNYCPENCRWVDRVAQANNRRTSKNITYAGQTHTLAEWASILDIPYKKLYNRIRRGWDLDRAFNT